MPKNREIERKFLVLNDSYKKEAYASNRIVQGYILNTPEKNVRIRIYGDKAFITIKGMTEKNSISRFEWEREILMEDAEQLFVLCEPNYIDKVRYLVKNGYYTFEVDEFHGANEGLTVAEIELHSENDSFNKPNWLGKEVTGDPQYYNSELINTPYTTWGLHKD